MSARPTAKANSGRETFGVNLFRERRENDSGSGIFPKKGVQDWRNKFRMPKRIAAGVKFLFGLIPQAFKLPVHVKRFYQSKAVFL
jgi:hypothetical protein